MKANNILFFSCMVLNNTKILPRCTVQQGGRRIFVDIYSKKIPDACPAILEKSCGNLLFPWRNKPLSRRWDIFSGEKNTWGDFCKVKEYNRPTERQRLNYRVFNYSFFVLTVTEKFDIVSLHNEQSIQYFKV